MCYDTHIVTVVPVSTLDMTGVPLIDIVNLNGRFDLLVTSLLANRFFTLF